MKNLFASHMLLKKETYITLIILLKTHIYLLAREIF